MHHRATVRAVCIEIDGIDFAQQGLHFLPAQFLVGPDDRMAGHGSKEMLERILQPRRFAELRKFRGDIAHQAFSFGILQQLRYRLQRKRVAAERFKFEPEMFEPFKALNQNSRFTEIEINDDRK